MPDKIQREVEDLLAKLDTFPPPKPWYVRLRESIADAIYGVIDAISSIPFPRLSAGHVLLISILVIVFGFFLFGSDGPFRWIIIGAIVVFIAAFAISLSRRSSGPTQQKYWRDQPIDLDKRSDRSRRGRRRGPR
jgi:hypothetical protein